MGTSRIAILTLIVAAESIAGPLWSAEPTPRQVVMVPLRDGVRLKTNIFFTGAADEAKPVLLLRTPYNQETYNGQAQRCAEAGFVAVTQDCRGRFGSEGQFVFYWGEGPDGFDTVEWLRERPWCNGRIGMWGTSYLGSVQWLTAAEGTNLTALAPAASAPNFYYNVHLGGVYLLSHAKGGFCMDLFGPATKLESSPDWPQLYMHLPLTDWGRHLKRELPWQMNMISHDRPDGFWKRADTTPAIPQMSFPAQHIVGYYDFMCRESVGGFQAMCKRSATEFSRAHQQLILGPWDHSVGERNAGEVDFGPTAELDVLTENLRWFNRFLRDEDSASSAFDRVRYFSLGENRWRLATCWPPEEAVDQFWYLSSAGHANTRRGDGVLSQSQSDEQEPADVFRSDPDDPVPCWPAKVRQYQEVWGPVDQALCQDRDDVLVYQSKPLDRPLWFAGSPSLDLYVATDSLDADWVVKLIDVDPGGVCLPLAMGVRRGSTRESELHPSPMEPGRHYRLTVELGHSAARIDKGHRLGIQIAGSNFPLFARNLHMAEGPAGINKKIAQQQVFHSSSELSRLVLPIIKSQD